MILAPEILIGTLPVASMIRDAKVFQIPNLMMTGKSIGMKLMEESILDLVKKDAISFEDALLYADKNGPVSNYINNKTIGGVQTTQT